MVSPNHLPGITAGFIQTRRLTHYVLAGGDETGFPMLFLHGNASSSTFWEETILALPEGLRGIAPDLRGYGRTDRAGIIDATRGLGDWVDDLAALADELGLDRFVLCGHSMGGFIAWGCLAAMPERIAGAILVAPGPPAGFGGTAGTEGKLIHPDGAGSGAGLVNSRFARRIQSADKGENDPQTAPRSIMNRMFWAEGFRAVREEAFLDALLSVHTGRKRFPGDFMASRNWPGFAPGIHGPVNALSPLYNMELAGRVVQNCGRIPILWIRGSSDRIVADESLSDAGSLGRLGLLQDWPGETVFPPQPMVKQTRHLLNRLQQRGSEVSEKMMAGCGHTPFIEKPDEFNEIVRQWFNSLALEQHIRTNRP